MTSIFLSYARGDDELFVRRLYDDLTSRGFDVWFDRVSMPSRQLTFLQEIRDAIAGRDRLLLIVGPNAITSDYVRQEWKSGLELGKCVSAVVRLNSQRDGNTIDGYNLIPEELKPVHAEDFREDSRYIEHLNNLVRTLSDPAPPLGKLVAVPTLPLHYLAQRDRLSELKDALLFDLKRPVVVTGAAGRIGIHGMGGIGKSVLAAALARDLEVRRAFPDGIFWINVGQQQNIVELQRFLAKELGDEALFNDVPAGKQALKYLLAGSATLLILDDVWQSTDANAFDVIGPLSKLLLTTRDAGLVRAMAGTGYQVELPSEAEAHALLANTARVPVESLSPLASDIGAECGKLPLALALCGGMVQAGITWRDLLDALQEHELEFLADEYALEDHHRNLWRAMEVSVRALPEDTQRRFAELAVFASGSRIPEAAVVVLWGYTGGLSERHTRRLLVEFKQRSLVQLDRLAGVVEGTVNNVSLHDLLHDFTTRLATHLFGSLSALHDQLLEGYRKQCSQGWPSGPNDGYFFQRLRYHLIGAGHSDQLVGLLLDLKWLEANVRNGLAFDLPPDFRESLRVTSIDHPKRRFLSLLEEALRRDIHFIARHREDYPQALFQCLWNSCWWYDCPQAANRYREKDGPWLREGPRICQLLEEWRTQKETETPGFKWLRSLRPPPQHLGTAQIAILKGHEDRVTSVAISADSQWVVSGSEDKTVCVWDLQTGKQRNLLKGHEAEVTSVAISVDSQRIVSGSGDGTVWVWDTETGEQINTLGGHEEEVTSIAISADSKRIVSGSNDKTVRIWEMATGKEIKVIKGHDYHVRSVALSADSQRVVSGSRDETVRVWDIESGKQLKVLEGQARGVESIAVSADNRRIVSCRTYDDTVHIWDMETGEQLKMVKGHEWYVNSVSISADSRRVVTGSGDQTVRIWDIETGEQLKVLEGHEDVVWSVAVSSDSRWIVSGSWDKTVRIWGTETGEELKVMKGHNSLVESVAISADGRRIVSGSTDNTVRIWDSETGEELKVLKGHRNYVSDIAISADGRWIVSGSGDGTVRVWDMETGRKVRVLRGHDYGVGSVAISADNRRIVSGSDDGTVRVWDMESGKKLKLLKAHEDWVMSVAISADARRILAGSGDGTICVWEMETGKEVKVLKGPKDSVLSLAISADSRRVVSRSLDETVCVWNMETGAQLQIFKCTAADVQAIADPQIFPIRALSQVSETLVDDEIGNVSAFFSETLSHIKTYPDGKAWAGAVGKYLCIIRLEGDCELSPVAYAPTPIETSWFLSGASPPIP
jgi:WD40 repeat protein